MATITFQKKREKQKYLGLALLAIIFLIFIVIHYGFLNRGGEAYPPVPSQPTSYSSGAIEINFDIFKNPLFEEALPFEKIKPFEGRIGRKNPFAPYPALLPLPATGHATSTLSPSFTTSTAAATPTSSSATTTF